MRLEKCNKGLDGVRGLEEREGDCVGERERGSEVYREACVCIGRVDGVRIVVGYNVLGSAVVANETAYVGDCGWTKFWVGREESSSLGSPWVSDSPFDSCSSSAAQLNPRPKEVTPQLFPTLTVRFKASFTGGAPQLSSSNVISTALGAVSIE